jgi:hypothetical protein
MKRSYILCSDDFVYNDAIDLDGAVDMVKIKKLCPFSVIHSHHLMKGHVGDHTTWESVKNSYSNISCVLCTKFVELCSCRVNQCLPNHREESPQSSQGQ